MRPTRRILLVLLALVLFTVPASSYEWQSTAKKVSLSLVSLSDFDGDIYCTGYVIDNQRDFVMTAQHCVDGDYGIIVDHKSAWVVWADKELDIAVLQVPGISKPELHPGKHPKIGQAIAALGHGYGLEQPMFRVGLVAHPDVHILELSGTWVILDFPLIPGMSGGPMVDQDGKVLAINQRSNTVIGLGKSIADIYPKSKDFWRYSE